MALDFSPRLLEFQTIPAETRNVRSPVGGYRWKSGRADRSRSDAAIPGEDPGALAGSDRYNGILKALILRVIHNEAEADDLLQEIFMEIWNQAKNFSAQKGKPLGWMVTLARRRAIDGLRVLRPCVWLRTFANRDRAATRRLGA